MTLIVRIFIAVCLVAACIADTPAHCEYEDIAGTWIFRETERAQSKHAIKNACQEFSSKTKT